MYKDLGKIVELGRIPSSSQGCTPKSLSMICKVYVKDVVMIW